MFNRCETRTKESGAESGVKSIYKGEVGEIGVVFNRCGTRTKESGAESGVESIYKGEVGRLE